MKSRSGCAVPRMPHSNRENDAAIVECCIEIPIMLHRSPNAALKFENGCSKSRTLHGNPEYVASNAERCIQT